MTHQSDWKNSKFLSEAYVSSFTGASEEAGLPQKIDRQMKHSDRRETNDPVVLAAVHAPVGGRELFQYASSKVAGGEVALASMASIEIAGFAVLFVSVLCSMVYVTRFLRAFIGKIG